MKFSIFVLCCCFVSCTSLVQSADRGKEQVERGRHGLDEQLRAALDAGGVALPESGSPEVPNAGLIELGQALYFDPILSGNRDIACATCHHPLLATGDALSLPIGTGAVVPGKLGPFREKGQSRHFIPRNAPEIFNRGSPLWTSQFWDSRVAQVTADVLDGFNSPAGHLAWGWPAVPGNALPVGFPNVLSVQAMFPVTSRDEMRGSLDDVVPYANELAAVPDSDLQGIWDLLMKRLLSLQGYRTLFSDAYGFSDDDLDDGAFPDVGFEHAATAIAAFEAEAFTFFDSPFDRYLAGDDQALSTPEKRGAKLFYGKAGCAHCHAGPLLTDQQHYNLLVPHLGPGKVAGAIPAIDPGRALQTLDEFDAFRFRTPPLRNVAVTGPYFHNGAYTDLEAAVWHHLDIVAAFEAYDPVQHCDQVELLDSLVKVDVGSTIPGDLGPIELGREEFRDLIKFLESLTAPRLGQRLKATIPNSVPSGLPLDSLRR